MQHGLLSCFYLADQVVTPMSAIIGALAFLNTLGIFTLVYQAGRLVGDNSRRWTDAQEKFTKLEAGQALIQSQEVNQARTEAALAAMKVSLEEARQEMRAEMKVLRRRSHELSNTMTRLILEGAANLRPLEVIEGNGDEKESS